MAVVGIGMDLVELERIQRTLERFGAAFERRVLAPGEREAMPVGQKKVAFVAARFAAKEAAVKALGTGFSEGIGPCEIEVTSLHSGQPCLVLHGHAAARSLALGVTRLHVTLTHSQSTAGAMVVLES